MKNTATFCTKTGGTIVLNYTWNKPLNFYSILTASAGDDYAATVSISDAILNILND